MTLYGEQQLVSQRSWTNYWLFLISIALTSIALSLGMIAYTFLGRVQ